MLFRSKYQVLGVSLRERIQPSLVRAYGTAFAASFALLVAVLALGGCDLFDRYFGAPPKKPLPGERVAVLRNESKIEPDQRIATLPADRAGVLMVFRAFERLSYGLVLREEQPLAVLDEVRNP